jgi:hypothetical protein
LTNTAGQLKADDTCAEQEHGDHRAPNVEAPFVLGRAKESRGIGRQQILRPSVWLTELVDEATKDRPLAIDSGDTQITADSVKEQAVSTFKRGFGFHRLWAFVDHGAEGTGEPLTFLLRMGNAGSKLC